jgi:hypothetical protein
VEAEEAEVDDFTMERGAPQPTDGDPHQFPGKGVGGDASGDAPPPCAADPSVTKRGTSAAETPKHVQASITKPKKDEKERKKDVMGAFSSRVKQLRLRSDEAPFQDSRSDIADLRTQLGEALP